MDEHVHLITNGSSLSLQSLVELCHCPAELLEALKKKGSQNKVWCFIGDGTEDNGHLFGLLRYVDGWNLPCNFVIESNNRSVEASNEDRWGTQSNLQWNFDCVTKYEYECSYPHCRKAWND